MSPWSRTQAVVGALLFVALAFMAISNHLGWTARVKVTAVKRSCERPDCEQKVFVEGRKVPFKVARDRHVEVGDLAEIRGECAPRCKLTLVSLSAASNLAGH